MRDTVAMFLVIEMLKRRHCRHTWPVAWIRSGRWHSDRFENRATARFRGQGRPGAAALARRICSSPFFDNVEGFAGFNWSNIQH
jgi:hypothetical protein